MTGDLFADFAAELDAAPPAPPPPPPRAPDAALDPIVMPPPAPPAPIGELVPADHRIPVSFACACGGRRELQQPAPASIGCAWCKGTMQPYAPRFTPPRGAGEPCPASGW